MTEEELLQGYYDAQSAIIWERSGTITRDIDELRETVDEYSRRRFGKSFDFSDED